MDVPITYEVRPAVINGDFNRDGMVDAADYVVWRNGVATPKDYEIWRAHFGPVQANSADLELTAVPEPCGVSILGLGLLSVALFRRIQALRVQVA